MNKAGDPRLFVTPQFLGVWGIAQIGGLTKVI